MLLLVALTTIRITGSVNFGKLKGMDKELYGTSFVSSRNYLLTQFRVIVTYLRLLLVPINQNLDYDYPIARSLFRLPVFASLILLLIILGIGFILFRRYRLLSFGIFWFFLTLIPESSIIPIRDVIYEHRLYLPMVGYALFLPSGLYYLLSGKKQYLLVPCLLIITLGYSTLTYIRNQVWRSDLTFWTDVVKKSPHKGRDYNNVGMAYGIRGEYEKALTYLNKAVALDPNLFEVYNNRALIYRAKGEYDQAIQDYNLALKINPTYAKAHNNRGNTYNIIGKEDAAMADYNQAIELAPQSFSEPYHNRGALYYKKGALREAIADYTQALRINPTYLPPYYNLIKIYRKQNREDELLSIYLKLLEQKSDSSIYNDLGILYCEKNLWDKALGEFENALRLEPTNAKSFNNLGIVYLTKGEKDKALQSWRKALQLDPRMKEARENLSKTLNNPNIKNQNEK